MHQQHDHSGLNIAIVEDHADLRELFVDFLSGLGHDVSGFALADELDEHLARKTPDLLILDLNLPGEDGYSIARRLRETHPRLHILMLTARTTVEDRLQGYVSGADLYLTKPVSPQELVVVVNNISRRLAQANESAVKIRVNGVNLTLAGPAGSLILTPPQLAALKGLAEAPERQLPYWRLQEILELEPEDKSKKYLEVLMHRLKKKLHDVGSPQPAIKSIWKEGYRLCFPVSFLN